MKKLSFILSVVLLLGYYSCGDDEDPVCLKECPGDCSSLDTEACECVTDIPCRCSDGIRNGNEEYIDCGADCEDCACENDICSWLSNSSSKGWEVAYMTLYPPTADTTFTDEMTDTQKGAIITFNVDGTSKWENSLIGWGPCYYTNSFDSVDNQLLWDEIEIGDVQDCEGFGEDVLIVQLTENLFAYRWPDANFVTYFKPLD